MRSSKWTLLEQFEASKSGILQDSEDGLFANEHFVAVIDGATSKGNERWNGLTGGQIIRNRVLYVLSNLGGKESKNEVFGKLIDDMNAFFDNNALDQYAIHCCASIIIYSVFYKEIWSLGDCQAWIGDQYYCRGKKVD